MIGMRSDQRNRSVHLSVVRRRRRGAVLLLRLRGRLSAVEEANRPVALVQCRFESPLPCAYRWASSHPKACQHFAYTHRMWSAVVRLISVLLCCLIFGNYRLIDTKWRILYQFAICVTF